MLSILRLMSSDDPDASMESILRRQHDAPISAEATHKVRAYLAQHLDNTNNLIRNGALDRESVTSITPTLDGLRAVVSRTGWHQPVKWHIADARAAIALTEGVQQRIAAPASPRHAEPRDPAPDILQLDRSFQFPPARPAPMVTLDGTSRPPVRIRHRTQALVPNAIVPVAAATPATERLRYIQLVRSVAILLVVAAHSSDPLTSNNLPNPIYPYLFMHSNALFVFVSGFLFQFLGARFHYPKYLMSKLRNVIIPYLIMSLPAMMVYAVGLKPFHAAAEYGYLSNLLLLVLTGRELAPFWFIPMISILFVFSPLLHFTDRRSRYYLAIVPLFVISYLLGRNPENPFQNALFYLPVYMTGMLASRYREQLLPRLRQNWPMLVLLSILPWTMHAYFYHADYQFLITKILWSLSLLGLLDIFKHRIPACVDWLGDMSFGIFFVHYYLIFGAGRVIAHMPVLGMPAFLATFVLTMTGSIAIVWTIQRCTGRYSRLIMGT